MRDDTVIKRYRSWDRREPEREWTALTLLAEHAPGLAPTPLQAALTADPPAIVMSRLPGVPLRGRRAKTEQLVAMATALTRLHQDIPSHAVEALPAAAWHPAAAVAKVRVWADKKPDLGKDPRVSEAFARGTAWLATTAPDELITNPLPPVLGLADGNLANYLWDAATDQVRIIDWEDSGSSDRAFELAEGAEHISYIDGHFDSDHLLALLDLAPLEAIRVRDFRRLLALGWFLMLGPDGPFASRNPPGALQRQADRVLTLLDE
ncbi:phosphotransferase family protein [Nonomuraea rubra]|uniref:phosphotransferase family protein n=1 Tax=Nonomuraea rubra TaxID=46180 RepID=UPI0033E53CAE